MGTDVIIAWSVVAGGLVYCELGLDNKLVNWFSDFIQKPVGVLLLLFSILTALFWKAIFLHDYIVFSNDGPLGTVVNDQSAMPQSINGLWMVSDYIGSSQPCYVPAISVFFRCICMVPGFNVLMLALIIITSVSLIKWRRRAWRIILIVYGCSGVIMLPLTIILWELNIIDPQGNSLWNTVSVFYTATVIPYGLAVLENKTK